MCEHCSLRDARVGCCSSTRRWRRRRRDDGRKPRGVVDGAAAAAAAPEPAASSAPDASETTTGVSDASGESAFADAGALAASDDENPSQVSTSPRASAGPARRGSGAWSRRGQPGPSSRRTGTCTSSRRTTYRGFARRRSPSGTRSSAIETCSVRARRLASAARARRLGVPIAHNERGVGLELPTPRHQGFPREPFSLIFSVRTERLTRTSPQKGGQALANGRDLLLGELDVGRRRVGFDLVGACGRRRSR